ncbi:MAG: 3-deoxy-manno-octulosonate cytidylyltransferase [bacterium]
MSEEKVIGIIPARYESTRFPGKPLAKIKDRTMIEWVVDAAVAAREIDEVYVATDDRRIVEVVEKTAAKAIMTPAGLSTGSDRVAVVARQKEAEIIVNIQGDEPLIRGTDLDRGIRALRRHPSLGVASFKAPCPPAEFENPDVVKVVTDAENRSLYFSRSPVPFLRGEETGVYQHVGIYIYRKEALFSFMRCEPTPLEKAEKLEQLRILENGGQILMVDLDYPTVGVDRPEDIKEVEDRLTAGFEEDDLR